MGIHREIYILAGLDHPNIMKLFEVIDSQDSVNLVVEYCHGPNLLEYIKKTGQKGRLGK
jgi:serine/threonine protein kinase